MLFFLMKKKKKVIGGEKYILHSAHMYWVISVVSKFAHFWWNQSLQLSHSIIHFPSFDTLQEQYRGIILSIRSISDIQSFKCCARNAVRAISSFAWSGQKRPPCLRITITGSREQPYFTAHTKWKSLHLLLAQQEIVAPDRLQ